jgi:hypothetical protein
MGDISHDRRESIVCTVEHIDTRSSLQPIGYSPWRSGCSLSKSSLTFLFVEKDESGARGVDVGPALAPVYERVLPIRRLLFLLAAHSHLALPRLLPPHYPYEEVLAQAVCGCDG